MLQSRCEVLQSALDKTWQTHPKTLPASTIVVELEIDGEELIPYVSSRAGPTDHERLALLPNPSSSGESVSGTGSCSDYTV